MLIKFNKDFVNFFIGFIRLNLTTMPKRPNRMRTTEFIIHRFVVLAAPVSIRHRMRALNPIRTIAVFSEPSSWTVSRGSCFRRYSYCWIVSIGFGQYFMNTCSLNDSSSNGMQFVLSKRVEKLLRNKWYPFQNSHSFFFYWIMSLSNVQNRNTINRL